MSAAAEEFEQLAKRYLQAQEYEKTKYLNDTPEGQEWATKEMIKLNDRMSELWSNMTDEERAKYDYIFK